MWQQHQRHDSYNRLRHASLAFVALAGLMASCGDDEGGDSSTTGLGGGLNSALGLNGGTGVTTTGTSSGVTTGTTSGTIAGGTAGTTSGVTVGTTTGTTSGITAGTNAGTGGDGGVTSGGDGGGSTSTGGTNTSGSAGYYADPVIPPVNGECPTFQSGSFSFMGLTGEMEVGAKGSGDGALLFYWHGTGGSARNFAGIGAGNIDTITSAGGIIFSVQGETGSGDASCSGTAVFDGDFSVIDQVVACAVQNHDINPRRIYATGCSAGGLQSGCMATRRADYMAAVAPDSGGLTSGFGASLSNSQTGHVPASMTMHGGADDTVYINFQTASANLNSVITGGGGFAVDCEHQEDGFLGNGHCAAPNDLYTAAIEFLLDHPFGVDPFPYASGLPGNFPNYCEIQ